MTVRILFTAAALFQALVVFAQEGPSRGVYQPYPETAPVHTPAPRGYQAFYVSHFGRHGSRHLSSEKNIRPVLDALEEGYVRGCLTSTGEWLRERVLEVYDLSDGLWGELSDRGVREHRQIAARLARSYPLAFRDTVVVTASIYPRCLVSAAASTGEILRHCPDSKFIWQVGNRYQGLINPTDRPAGRTSGSAARRNFMAENRVDSLIIPQLFTDDGSVTDPVAFCSALYLAWAIREAVDLPSFDLGKVIGEEQARLLGQSLNLWCYQDMGFPGAPALLEEMVRKADRAARSGKAGADLRYAHDSGLMKLLVGLGVEGYPDSLAVHEAALYDFAERIPLAANFQLVLYKNRKHDVLVKFLVNEKECRIPALGDGPYYRWNDFMAVAP